MTPFDLNIRHLRAVPAVIQTGSLSAAAQVVNLTQPAITQGLAKLERQLGVTLFERRAKGMVATEAAQLLAPRVQAAMRLMGPRHGTGAQISAFLAVVRTGGYAAAAQATGLSEASLHRSVADLSLATGHILVERRGKGVSLTARGASMARRLRLAEAELRSALTELALIEGREVGRIVIGAMPLSRARLLPEAVTRFHAEHPDIALSIVEGSHADLVGPLRDGELDLMVGALREATPDDGQHRVPLFEDRPVILGRVGHPLLAHKGPLTPEQMLAYPWIAPGAATPLRQQWEAMFKAVGASPPPVPIECGAVIMTRQIMRGTDFLTLLSPDQVAVELEAKWLAKIADAPGDVSRTIGITTRSDWRPTRLQQKFIAGLKEQAEIIKYES